MGLLERLKGYLGDDSGSAPEESEISSDGVGQSSGPPHSRHPDIEVGESYEQLYHTGHLPYRKPLYYISDSETVQHLFLSSSSVYRGIEKPLMEIKTGDNRKSLLAVTDKRFLFLIGQDDANKKYEVALSACNGFGAKPNPSNNIRVDTSEFYPVILIEGERHKYLFYSETAMDEDDVLRLGDFVCRRTSVTDWENEDWWRQKRINRIESERDY